MKYVLVGFFLLLSGCANERFHQMPAVEKDPFFHCEREIRKSTCGGDSGCVIAKQADYARLQTSAERAEFLTFNGCPAQMVRVPPTAWERANTPDAG